MKEKKIPGESKYILKVMDQPLVKLMRRLKYKGSKIICIHNIVNGPTKSKKKKKMGGRCQNYKIVQGVKM